MKRLGILFFALVPLMASAQKIKYKDLFPLLEAKNYDDGEPQLIRFISEPKNANHPNANYHMALIMEKKMNERDAIQDSASVLSAADSTLIFYIASKTLITEKELKKNDEFYQSFYRRDLRTGEFGIKISDVHLEIEKKIEEIEGIKAALKELALRLESLAETEQSMINAFNDLVDVNTSYEDLVLKAGIDEISGLGTLQDFQKSFDDAAQEIATITGKVEDGYYESVTYTDVPSFGKLEAQLNAEDGTLESWNIGKWASATKAEINGKVTTLKTSLEAVDEELTNAFEQLKAGTMAEFPKELPIELKKPLLKYDDQSVAIDMLLSKIDQNIFYTLADTSLNPSLKDSLMIIQQVNTNDSIVHHLTAIKIRLEEIEQRFDPSISYYQDYYVARYQDNEGARQYALELKAWADTQLEKWTASYQFWDTRNNWGMAGADSIPLHPKGEAYRGSFVTLGTLDVGAHDIIAYGVKRDSLLGFAARFGADRNLIWQVRFDCPQLSGGQLPNFEVDTLPSDQADLAFYFFDKEKMNGAQDLTV
ncbi:MAG: hypothetical protein KI790_17815, partial [Cyclobacteriaceae bacterium]|nr:hypothetical protein [Cyclobacteriaceae bacterium HetDA_MAG_MS6]